MKVLELRAFYLAIQTRKEKNEFKDAFLKEAKLRDATFQAYISNTNRDIPHLSAKSLYKLALKLQPALCDFYFNHLAFYND